MQPSPPEFPNGALLINKSAGISSFGVIEKLQRFICEKYGIRRRDIPKLGHGGTLDPFATGLLLVCMGRGVKLARYFLGSDKIYEGTFRFGETTVPGDPTDPISETSDVLPETLAQIQEAATRFTLQDYLQTPPMHSAKKKDGKPLYELARQGIEIEREPKLCRLHSFEILSYEKPRATFRLTCTSGTYIRTLAQDLGKMLGSVALLENLNRLGSGRLRLASAMSLDEIVKQVSDGTPWNELPCWIPFDRLLEDYDRAEADSEEARALTEGRQNVLFNILRRMPPLQETSKKGGSGGSHVAIYCGDRLIAVAAQLNGAWGLERVFAGSTD